MDRLRKRRVLIVDDDRWIREELAAALGQDPALEISVADDGMVALRRVATGQILPDAILLDLMMPAVDGGEFLAALDAINKTRAIAIIVMTAHRPPDVPQAIKARARSILFKPFTIGKVTAALRAAFDGV